MLCNRSVKDHSKYQTMLIRIDEFQLMFHKYQIYVTSIVKSCFVLFTWTCTLDSLQALVAWSRKDDLTREMFGKHLFKNST